MPSPTDDKALPFLACRLRSLVSRARDLGEQERTFGHLDVGAGGVLETDSPFGISVDGRLSKPPGNLREYCTVARTRFKLCWPCGGAGCYGPFKVHRFGHYSLAMSDAPSVR